MTVTSWQKDKEKLSTQNVWLSKNCWKIFLVGKLSSIKMLNLGLKPAFWGNLRAKLELCASIIFFVGNLQLSIAKIAISCRASVFNARRRCECVLIDRTIACRCSCGWVIWKCWPCCCQRWCTTSSTPALPTRSTSTPGIYAPVRLFTDTASFGTGDNDQISLASITCGFVVAQAVQQIHNKNLQQNVAKF